jgi:hypothetical protein
MNPYTVRYAQDALDQLTEIWIEAGPEREAVTSAAHRIETLLATNPAGHGASEHEGLWKLDVPPLRVLFTIEETDKTVSVVGMGKLGPPPAPPSGYGEVQPPDKEA